MPSLRRVNTSRDPGTSRITAATRADRSLSRPMSGPNTRTTTSPRAPTIISCTRMSMGWPNV